MKRLIVGIMCLVCSVGCASKEEQQQTHQKVEALRATLHQGDLVEVRRYQGEGTRIMGFWSIFEVMGAGAEVRMVGFGYGPSIDAMTLQEFEKRLVRIVPRDSPEFAAAAHRYFDEGK